LSQILKSDLNLKSDVFVEILKSNRKSYSIKIIKENIIELRVPNFFSNSDIEKVLDKHRRWLNSHLFQVRVNNNDQIKEINSFNKMILLNKVYIVEIVNDSKSRPNYEFYKNDENIDIIKIINIRKLEKNVSAIMEFELKPIINNLLTEINEKSKIKFKFKKIKFSNAATRWGSCSNNGNINLSWRLCMCPLHVIFSILVHELAHTIHFNHSKNFYDLVDSIDENRIKSDKWLKENAYILKLYRY